MRRDATRNHATILEAAIGVLAASPAASMQEIAQASGTGRTTLYRHFPDRNALVRAIYTRVLAEADAMILSALEGAGPADDPLTALGELATELAGLGDRYRFLEGHVNGRLRREARAESPGARQFLAFIESAQARGQVRADLTARWLADTVGAIITRAASHAFTGAEQRRFAVSEAVRGVLSPL